MTWLGGKNDGRRSWRTKSSYHLILILSLIALMAVEYFFAVLGMSKMGHLGGSGMEMEALLTTYLNRKLTTLPQQDENTTEPTSRKDALRPSYDFVVIPTEAEKKTSLKHHHEKEKDRDNKSESKTKEESHMSSMREASNASEKGSNHDQEEKVEINKDKKGAADGKEEKAAEDDLEAAMKMMETPATGKRRARIWPDLSAPVADWDYFPADVINKQSVKEPTVTLDPTKCSKLSLVSSAPKQRHSKGACNGYDGVLHIQHGDRGGASGTIFFLFVLGMLQWADQHNYIPWVHLDQVSTKVYDKVVHSQGNNTKFSMMAGMQIGWVRDKRDPVGYLFPGKPQQKEGEELSRMWFQVQGTGIWEHYFMPVSEFAPGDESCRNKPIVFMDKHQVVPGIHRRAPWVSRAWRFSSIDYLNLHNVTFDEWFEPQRRSAAKSVQRYIRFNADMEQRAACAHPNAKNSLGMHIRHADKWIERTIIPVKAFLPYANAFVENGGGSIFIATDSSLVIEEIMTKWPESIRSHVVYQEGVQGLSPNGTAAFDLITSKHQSNTEALTDLLALSKCTYFLHGLSQLSEAVFYLNPGLVERSINLEDKQQGRDVEYFSKKIMHAVKEEK